MMCKFCEVCKGDIEFKTKNRQKPQSTQIDEKLADKTGRLINCVEQNNDNTPTRFRSSFYKEPGQDFKRKLRHKKSSENVGSRV